MTMKFASLTQRLDGLGGAKWAVHAKARALAAAGRDVVELTIGEPDVPVPTQLVDATIDAIRAGRTKYADGQGEIALREALASHYRLRAGRDIQPDNVLCLPGTQTALYVAISCLAEAGDAVLVGDPMYATYESVVRASGAEMLSVPLRAAHGFRMQARDIRARINDNTRVLLLTTPHNPTGAILSQQDFAEIGQVALDHDLWIVTDEVYADLVFDGQTFVSGLAQKAIQDRVVLVSSISKSHAAPGFRSGWCIGPAAFIQAADAMLFGNQPFIADMTAMAVRQGSSVARGMAQRYAARATHMMARLKGTGLGVHQPQAGMFALVDVHSTGLSGDEFAAGLLEQVGVAVMPGSSFGESLADWVRIALTVDDQTFDEGLSRIIQFVRSRSGEK